MYCRSIEIKVTGCISINISKINHITCLTYKYLAIRGLHKSILVSIVPLYFLTFLDFTKSSMLLHLFNSFNSYNVKIKAKEIICNEEVR